jgi:hypothetical protein
MKGRRRRASQTNNGAIGNYRLDDARDGAANRGYEKENIASTVRTMTGGARTVVLATIRHPRYQDPWYGSIGCGIMGSSNATFIIVIFLLMIESQKYYPVFET